MIYEHFLFCHIKPMKIPQDSVEKLLDNYVFRVFGQDFKYRPQQKEAIMDIILAFFDGTCNLYLLDAPTGSGKSVIAAIVAGFLTEIQMKGYILASDLSLQSQYEKDFEKIGLEWGSIKGVDNYTCVVNNEKFSIGECKIKNVSYAVAESLPCFQDCGYLYSRRKAIKSPVSLLNYSYWLIQRNYVEGKMKEKGNGVPFPKRDFTICDEAHKITEIVQNHFSPRIDERTVEKLEKIRTFLQKNNLNAPRTSLNKIKLTIKNLFKEDDETKIYSYLKEIELYFLDFLQSGRALTDYAAKKYKDVVIPKEWRYHIGLVDWAKDCHCKFEDYNHIVLHAGLHNIIKNVQLEQIVFNCLDESYMMDRYFHSQAGFKLLMTATMGDPSVFLKNIGAVDARYFRIDSNFDYSKSPIIYFPNRRMSMNQKEATLPWIIKIVNEILDKHPEENGIIHSGSYDISSRIFSGLTEKNKQRVLIYKGTQEKTASLEKFLHDKHTILMGPSILEGLDLSAEKSRIQIFVKMPFPSLGDIFVRTKMNVNQGWYDWKTSSNILQGVGRSVRDENDWAVTYILDGCFSDLLKRARKNFPIEFQNRIVIKNDI